MKNIFLYIAAILLTSCAVSKPVNIPGVTNAHVYPVKKLKLISTTCGENKNYNDCKDIYADKKGNKVIFKFEHKNNPNGVWLLDPKGNTMAKAEKDIYTSSVESPDEGVPVSADFNNDGIVDYCAQIHTRGAGTFSDRSQYVFFLSFKDEYKAKVFNVTLGGDENFVKFGNDNACYLIIQNMFDTEIDTPVRAPEEMPVLKPDEPYRKEIIKTISEVDGIAPEKVTEKQILDSWYSISKNDFSFIIYYPVRISGTDFIVSNGVNRAFPVIISVGSHGGGSKCETKLLTEEQKRKLWKDNVESSMGSEPIISKEFIQPK